MRNLAIPTQQDFIAFNLGEVIEPEFDDADLELIDIANHWSNYIEAEAA